MKKLITLLIFVSLGATIFAQGYYLEKFRNTSSSGYAITDLFVLGDKIWGSTSSNGTYQSIYFDGSSWTFPQQPINQTIFYVRGFKKSNNEAFVTHSRSNICYIWNNSINNFDYFSSPVTFLSKSFALTENDIYLCTSKKTDSDNKAHLYRWDGSATFTNIVEKSDVNFGDVYAKGQNNILLLSVAVENNVIIENKLLRYDGSQLLELYSLGTNNNRGTARTICSNDGNIFFIPTLGGDVYKWDDTNQQGTKVYSYPDEENGTNFSRGIVVKDNDNIFVYGTDGVKHIRISTNEVKKLKYYYGEEYGWVDPVQLTSGFYDKYNDKAYFGRNDGQIFILKFDTGSGVNDINLSNKLSIYPNPVIDNLSIELPITGKKSGAVYNIIGAKMMTFNIADGDNVIDVSKLPEGVYILNLETAEGRRASKKFIKK